MSTYDQAFLRAIRERQGRTYRIPASSRLLAVQVEFGSDIDVLNYALTLEHLEAAFYQMAGHYDLGTDGYGNSINGWMIAVGEHETAHVETLTQVIADLGDEPVVAAEYDFGVTDASSFLATAAIMENLGVAAYDGAAASIQDPGLLTAAGSIVAVEARHAAYLNLLTGASPFPEAYEAPMSPDDVLAAAAPFIVGGL